MNVQVVILYFHREGNSPDHHLTITYSQLLRQVCRCANALKLLGKTTSSEHMILQISHHLMKNCSFHLWSLTFKSDLNHILMCDTGIKKGDRVAIYLPMIPELVYTMLACARIGAVHSIVVSKFTFLLNLYIDFHAFGIYLRLWRLNLNAFNV